MIFAAYSAWSSSIPCGANTRWNATRCSGSLSTSVPSRSNSSAVFISLGLSRASALAFPISSRRRSTRESTPSHCRSDLPGGEFRIAVSQEFRLRPLARSNRENLVEYLLALVGDRDAVKDVAAIDVHVLDHPAIRVVVGGELDRRRRLAAVSRAAPGGEAEDVGAAGDLARCRHRIVARRIHEHEALGGDRLGVFIDFVQRGRAALRGCAQRLLENGCQASGLVSGRGVVVHLVAVAGAIVFP